MPSVLTLLSIAIAAAALVGTILFSVREAWIDSNALRRAQAIGVYLNPVNNWLARGTLRREMIRAVKCVLILVGLSVDACGLDQPYLMQVRNLCFVLIAILLFTNSWDDYRVKLKALHEVERFNEEGEANGVVDRGIPEET